MKKRLLIEKITNRKGNGDQFPDLQGSFIQFPPPPAIKPFSTILPLNIFLIRNFFVIM